ncbi:hypothetical protein HYI07_03850 [Clostridium botulinum]|uniref:Uncharacterized protein n=1 Tax=Clostridium botulinum (strain Okra / Type B1) TaxID=498213 RepID=B1IGP8_CLOBK|nr:hypothetical protein [Clostridium botulinum]EKX80469.1 hypothetical protein CFSAN001628_006649 [Clostridium botulinum CFSAN001628]ACA43433.1 hypothetical protein CLD_2429 [Clostridium botulinum B1 str. Okra]MBD5564030.1 hypothetical protein [Clostridium botulinum]MBD5566599.1 hypothetical protein [Clostridium botulinum]MBD5568885.1 hypothetical protein [Clostridium botulinum]
MGDLLKALNLIKETCDKQEGCKKCPLSSEDICLITEHCPSEWDVQTEPIVKLMLFKE